MDDHFIGHLANERNACVSMVNHPEHAELTIMSERIIGSNMYKWAKNGEVEQIPEVFSNGETCTALENEDVEGLLEDVFEDDEMYTEDFAEELFIEAKMTAAQAASVPTTAKLQVQVCQ